MAMSHVLAVPHHDFGLGKSWRLARMIIANDEVGFAGVCASSVELANDAAVVILLKGPQPAERSFLDGS